VSRASKPPYGCWAAPLNRAWRAASISGGSEASRTRTSTGSRFQAATRPDSATKAGIPSAAHKCAHCSVSRCVSAEKSTVRSSPSSPTHLPRVGARGFTWGLRPTPTAARTVTTVFSRSLPTWNSPPSNIFTTAPITSVTHDLQARDHHFRDVIEGGAHSNAQEAHNPAQQPSAGDSNVSLESAQVNRGQPLVRDPAPPPCPSCFVASRASCSMAGGTGPPRQALVAGGDLVG
jgi:hypothetical protein